MTPLECIERDYEALRRSFDPGTFHVYTWDSGNETRIACKGFIGDKQMAVAVNIAIAGIPVPSALRDIEALLVNALERFPAFKEDALR